MKKYYILTARGAMAEKAWVLWEMGYFPDTVCRPSLPEPVNAGVGKRFSRWFSDSKNVSGLHE